MNSLSLLIYLADFLPNLHETAGILAVVTGFALVPYLITYGYRSMGDEDAKSFNKAMWFIPIVFVVSLTIFTFAPSRQTIMMIAASEFGEEIATSAEAKNIGGKAYKSLDKFLSKYLEDERDGN